jgi:hypothetical protein
VLLKSQFQAFVFLFVRSEKKTNDDGNNYKVIKKSVFAHSKVALDNLVSRIVSSMAKCKSKFLPAAFAWCLLLSLTTLFFYYP